MTDKNISSLQELGGLNADREHLKHASSIPANIDSHEVRNTEFAPLVTEGAELKKEGAELKKEALEESMTTPVDSPKKRALEIPKSR